MGINVVGKIIKRKMKRKDKEYTWYYVQIPKEIVEALGLKEGNRVIIEIKTEMGQ